MITMTQILRVFARHACGKAGLDVSNKVIHGGKESAGTVSYCVNHVKKYDRENYLAALFIKDPKMKRIVFALRAFNVELSLVRDATTNSDRAKLRFHFWSKLVEEIITRNDILEISDDKLNAYYEFAPVAKEMLDVFHPVDMDEMMKSTLKDLIGARVSSKVLGYKPFETIDELELYCSKSNSSIYQLAWSMTQQVRNVWHSNYDITATVEKISATLGVAHGLSNVIRGISYNATKNCCYVPKDILDEHQLTNRDFVGKKFDGEKVAPAVKKLSLRCQTLMDEVYKNHGFIPNYFRHLFLTRVPIQDSLNRLAKCNYNLSHPSLAVRNELLPFNLWMASKYFRAPIL